MLCFKALCYCFAGFIGTANYLWEPNPRDFSAVIHLTIIHGSAPIAAPNVFIITSVPWARPVPAKYCQDSIPSESAKAARIDHGPIRKERAIPNGKYRNRFITISR